LFCGQSAAQRSSTETFSVVTVLDTDLKVWNGGVGLDWAAAKSLTISNQIEYSKADYDGADATAWRYMLGVVRSF
jgi:hypothetical protein